MANFRTQAGPDGVPTLGRKITALYLFLGIANSCQSSPSDERPHDSRDRAGPERCHALP